MLNNSNLVPPIAFAVSNCQRIAKLPNGIEEYWSADIKAVRHGIFNQIFAGILFVEKPGELVFWRVLSPPME